MITIVFLIFIFIIITLRRKLHIRGIQLLEWAEVDVALVNPDLSLDVFIFAQRHFLGVKLLLNNLILVAN